MNLHAGRMASCPSHRMMRVLAILVLLGSGACSHMNPYENAEQVPPTPDDNRRVLAPSHIAGPDISGVRYVSTMHEQLERVDVHRVRLQGIIGKIGSEREFYDAALWLAVPLIAFSPAPQDVAKGAAVLGAGYGFLNTRPKEQVPILQNAVGQLTCLMIEYSPFVYTNKDFGEQSLDGGYSKRLEALSTAIENFEKSTSELIRSVPVIAPAVKSVACASDPDPSPDCDARTRAKKRTTAIGNQAEIDRYVREVRERAGAAHQQMEELAVIEDRILRFAPLELGVRSQLIVASIGQRQEAVRPVLIAPDTLFGASREGVKAPAGGATAQSGHKASAIQAAAGLPLLRGLNKENKALQSQADDADRTLSVQRRLARAFIAAYRDRVDKSQVLKRRYCTEFAADPRPLAERRSSEPSSDESKLEERK